MCRDMFGITVVNNMLNNFEVSAICISMKYRAASLIKF